MLPPFAPQAHDSRACLSARIRAGNRMAYLVADRVWEKEYVVEPAFKAKVRIPADLPGSRKVYSRLPVLC